MSSYLQKLSHYFPLAFFSFEKHLDIMSALILECPSTLGVLVTTFNWGAQFLLFVRKDLLKHKELKQLLAC